MQKLLSSKNRLVQPDSRPKAAGADNVPFYQLDLRAARQPPEGGWLGIQFILDILRLVQPDSRPKAAG